MPVPHGKDLPVHLPPAVLENIADDDVEGDDVYRPEDDFTPQRFSQTELNDLVRVTSRAARHYTDYSARLGGHKAGSREPAGCSGRPNEAHWNEKLVIYRTKVWVLF
jgi:hypothetical protein